MIVCAAAAPLEAQLANIKKGQPWLSMRHSCLFKGGKEQDLVHATMNVEKNYPSQYYLPSVVDRTQLRVSTVCVIYLNQYLFRLCLVIKDLQFSISWLKVCILYNIVVKDLHS